MPDIFFMFFLLFMMIILWSGLIIMKVVEKSTDVGKKAVFGALVIYLIERFKK